MDRVFLDFKSVLRQGVSPEIPCDLLWIPAGNSKYPAVMTTALLILATLLTAYYALTHLAGLLRRSPMPTAPPMTRFAILIPAHDEESTLGRTLQSVQRLDYPKELLTVTVVADNCTDGTATRARSFAVHVLERQNADLRGKGYALEYALQSILPGQPDAVMILDADAELATDVLSIFDARLQNGAAVVQGSIRTRNADAGASSLVAAVGNVMDDRVSAGRDVLRMRVPLRGSNMVFRREILERIPWQCYGLTEDADYAARLAAAGVRIRFEPAARCVSESAADLAALAQQRRRWRAALSSLVNWFDSKPIVLLQLLLTTVLTLVWGTTTELIWLGAVVLVNVILYGSALATVGVQLRTIVAVPVVVARLAAVAFAGLWQREERWLRTPRALKQNA